MSRNATNEPNRLSPRPSVWLSPRDSQQYGYLSEHHSFGDTEEKAGDYAEDLAATMLATLGIEFDSSKDWDEREKQYKASGKFITTSNVTNRPKGHKDGLWTTVLASAVFVLEGEQQIENQVKI